MPGACSIGVRPTVGGSDRRLEVFILDFDGDLYGSDLEIEFAARLRDELKFDSLDALTAQIAADVERARQILGVDRDVEKPGTTPSESRAE
jgi:riboflavin kinase/FMN adenylyltransferase